MPAAFFWQEQNTDLDTGFEMVLVHRYWKNWGFARSLLSFTFFPVLKWLKFRAKGVLRFALKFSNCLIRKYLNWRKKSWRIYFGLTGVEYCNTFAQKCQLLLVWLRFFLECCRVCVCELVVVVVGYIGFEPFWGHFWTGFQIDNKASAINLNARELTEKLANWRRNKRERFEELIFTELWLERIKEIYITTYQSDTWTNSEQIKFRLLEKSNFNQSLAYGIQSD